MYKCWSKLDSKFDERVKSYPDALNGIRVLYLNPVENLFSFICICILLLFKIGNKLQLGSSNNMYNDCLPICKRQVIYFKRSQKS